MPHHPTALERAVTRLGLVKLGQTDLAGVLTHVVTVAAGGLDAPDVSITIVGAGDPHTAASTSATALRLDAMQYQLRDGPGLRAAVDRTTVLLPDTASEVRWSPWSQRAAAAGAGSVLSIGLPVLEDVGGALNIYGRFRDAFGVAAVKAAQAFAEHATVTLANAFLYDRTADLARQMQSAMAHRAVIEQAKGVIMGERRCGPDEAFAVLTRTSQNSNRKLRDIAAGIVARTQAASEPAGSEQAAADSG